MECSEKSLTLAETARMDHPTSKVEVQRRSFTGEEY
jgi:hypothetical protein